MMRIRSLRKFYCVVIVFLVSIKNVAAHILNTDTTKLLASLAAKKPSEFKINISEYNAKYPESLEEEREQSLSYIENFSDKKRDYLIHIYEEGKKYFPKIESVLKEYQLPVELKVLIALESGFKANAVSKAGAVGYWQIMREVGQAYGLHIGSTKNKHTGKLKRYDDRKDFEKSTLFAAKYFQDCQTSLNDNLLLMVASYNCGIGRVHSAMKRSGKTDPDFWDVKKYLPEETRKYVMNFIALNVIFENYENFSSNQLLFLPHRDDTNTISVYENAVPVTPPAVD